MSLRGTCANPHPIDTMQPPAPSPFPTVQSLRRTQTADVFDNDSDNNILETSHPPFLNHSDDQFRGRSPQTTSRPPQQRAYRSPAPGPLSRTDPFSPIIPQANAAPF